ncbi:MAG: sensor histidine kinase [Steroidobacteraceae bacterium]
MSIREAASSPATATILIVDDTPANLALIVEYLEARHFRMLVAQGGEEGLQRALLVQPDLILLDAIMPGIDGFEVCRRLKSRDSTRDIPVIFMTSLADTQDKLTAFAVGAVDYVVKPLQVEEVMARVNAQLALRAMHRQLTAANRELEAFTYSVSHDLRAPLRAISSFAHILEKDCRGNMGEDGARCLDKIIATSARMATLIEDLLLYARTACDPEAAVAVPLAPLAQHLAVIFGERIASAGARLDVVEPLAAPLGDPTLIGQILNNLVDNALTYCCAQVAPQVRVTSRRIGGHVVIQVADNGIGIEPQYHEKIFQVFQRLHSADEYPGTGLGLAIVAKAVRVMEGDVSVESTPGRGSTFTVRLPAPPHDAGLAD